MANEVRVTMPVECTDEAEAERLVAAIAEELAPGLDHNLGWIDHQDGRSCSAEVIIDSQLLVISLENESKLGVMARPWGAKFEEKTPLWVKVALLAILVISTTAGLLADSAWIGLGTTVALVVLWTAIDDIVRSKLSEPFDSDAWQKRIDACLARHVPKSTQS